MFFEQMHPDWQELLADQRTRLSSIESALQGSKLQPEPNLVMRSFWQPPGEVKVVILGQDPYPNPEHAVGLAFAVPPASTKLPATLRNIQRELISDLDLEPTDALLLDLSDWATQGVLLLNRHLTTSPGESLAHQAVGWQAFTDVVVERLARALTPPPIFVLWGNQAQQVRPLLAADIVVIESAHPSPLSAHRGFLGSRPFSRINQTLNQRGQAAINWAHHA